MAGGREREKGGRGERKTERERDGRVGAKSKTQARRIKTCLGSTNTQPLKTPGKLDSASKLTFCFL